MGIDLLQTKLFIPSAQPNLVPRAHLHTHLNRRLQQGSKLSLFSAPAGFGKTTLAANWLCKAGLHIAWLSLDEADDDPARFTAYLLATLRQHGLAMGEAVQEILAAPQPLPLDVLLTAIINDILSQPTPLALVLDDYHLLENPVIHQAMAFLIEHQPPPLHLVLITREDPPLPLARLRARQQMTEIRLADLRFSSEEIVVLLNDLMGLNLNSDHIKTLADRTEGWIAGLQLAALSMQGQKDVDAFVQSFAGSNRYILDFLLEEVFQQQSEQVQTFLLNTSILEKLTAPLCTVLIHEKSTRDFPSKSLPAQTILEQLEQANLFIIPLDADRRWYRYHHLFADLLHHRLRQENKNLTELHARAASWHAANGFPNEAIHHYLAADAWEPAADLITNQSDALLKRGENITLMRWVRSLPEDVILNRPELCLDCAWALALNSEIDQAETFLQVAEAAAVHDPAFYGGVLTAQIHIARARHDLPRTIALSQRALELIPADEHETRSVLNLNLGLACWQLGSLEAALDYLLAARTLALQTQNHHVALLAIGILGIIHATQGELSAAAANFQEALSWGGAYPASALIHSTQGAILYEWNRLSEAETQLRQAIDLAARSGNTEILSGAYRQLAFVEQAQGKDQAALAAVNKAIQCVGEMAPPHTQGRNTAARIRIALAQGDFETAALAVAQMPAAAASPFYLLLYLAPARLALAQGDKKTAASHLAVEYDTAAQAGWRYGQIEIRLLQALAAADEQSAAEFVADALIMGEQEGFIRTFLDHGEELIPFIHLSASRNITPNYAQKLLKAFGGQPSRADQVTKTTLQKDLVEPLTGRELEILRLLAAGQTNQEIAQAMIVSVNTVKSHLKNVYGKLGVNNRRAAVAQARVLGLIRSDGT